MRILLTLLRKEILQIMRNKMMLVIIFVFPVIEMIIMVYAASPDKKNINFVVVDPSQSPASRRLISHFQGSSFYTYMGSSFSYQSAEKMIIADKADLLIHLNSNFEKDLYREGSTDVQLIINAINATEAGLIKAYSNQIIAGFNKEIRQEWLGVSDKGKLIEMNFSVSYWYNHLLDYKIYMFSGILVIVVTLIGMFLTALNLVREKELGTAEQMNVTPMKKHQFILSKLLPFLFIALFELAFGLLIGVILFNLPVRGSLVLLFGFAIVFLTVALGLGLFLSTISNTQQQLMFLAFFFLITFILMSGVFTPAESMPPWAQKINILNPMAYFMKAIRMILLKGSGFADVAKEFYSLLIYGIIILSLAIFNYRKTT